jgi:hypothetical protein
MLTQKKEDGMCCHECLPRRKKMGCGAMNVDPEERRWSVVLWMLIQKKDDGVCCYEC